MPAEGESTYPADWLQIAAEDFQRVPRRLAEGDVTDAAFHLQQALEKYLKAFLLSKGWKLERIHDLRALLEEAARHELSLKRFRRLCAEVSQPITFKSAIPSSEQSLAVRKWKPISSGPETSLN